MPPDQFAFAVKLILGIEGPDSDNAETDPDGGLTRFGISQTQNPNLDVASLTVADATDYYRHNYYSPACCDDLPWPIGVLVFDSAVNQGEGTAERLLQAALGVTVDGVIGPQTLAAAHRADAWDLAARYSAKRALAYTQAKEWRQDGEGWIYRVARVLVQCAVA